MWIKYTLDSGVDAQAESPETFHIPSGPRSRDNQPSRHSTRKSRGKTGNLKHFVTAGQDGQGAQDALPEVDKGKLPTSILSYLATALSPYRV
jgi:hypothetical protein